ncbi:MAG: Antibiotic biosynthesis monooxygenase [uncultured Rubrobacteraceae bacterium]|uniref:Antibiotic biosynthesis monooxygenase n=1 Tax=uncultured Rubrobacteraceae bacterium TaxID=349277 RepID=A0A6J4PQ28_9ACTN|nr:MAG: Antibiotic biosynthesis monooxygenase [uncultured Rubrobacteraceae bacterium]
MILEVALLDVLPERTDEFEMAFAEASEIISSAPGYLSHEPQRCIETPERYVLLVHWETLEAHTKGFRGSDGYGEMEAAAPPLLRPFSNRGALRAGRITRFQPSGVRS